MMPDFAFVGTYVEGSAVNLLARINQSHGNAYLIGHACNHKCTYGNCPQITGFSLGQYQWDVLDIASI